MTPRPSAGGFAALGACPLTLASHPLQVGMPGGPEIVIILLLLLMVLLPIALVVLVVVGVLRLRGSGSTDDRVADLERRVAELETELRAERTRDDESAPHPDDEDRW